MNYTSLNVNVLIKLLKKYSHVKINQQFWSKYHCRSFPITAVSSLYAPSIDRIRESLPASLPDKAVNKIFYPYTQQVLCWNSIAANPLRKFGLQQDTYVTFRISELSEL